MTFQRNIQLPSLNGQLWKKWVTGYVENGGKGFVWRKAVMAWKATGARNGAPGSIRAGVCYLNGPFWNGCYSAPCCNKCGQQREILMWIHYLYIGDKMFEAVITTQMKKPKSLTYITTKTCNVKSTLMSVWCLFQECLPMCQMVMCTTRLIATRQMKRPTKILLTRLVST